MLSSTSLLLFLSSEAMILGGNRATGANYSLGKKFVLCTVGGTVFERRGVAEEAFCGQMVALQAGFPSHKDSFWSL